MDGRPKATYDPFVPPTIPPIGGPVSQQPPIGVVVDPKAYPAASIMDRDSSLPSINSLMRVPTTSASPVASYNPHLAAAQQPLGMYQPYPTLPPTGVGAAIPGYQGIPLPVPAGASSVASPLSAIPAASDSPQIYDLDKNFHLNAPVPQYPPAGAGEIPPPGYGGHHYGHQRPYGNYHPTSSYGYQEDYYLAGSYNNYTEYGNPMVGYQGQIPSATTATPGGIDPSHGSVLQPLGQQVTQLQPVHQQPPPGAMVTTLSSTGNGPQLHGGPEVPPEASTGGGGTSGKKSGGSSSSGSDKKAEKKPTMSSMARYVCNHCDGKEFVSLPVISKHIRQHNLQLCNLCVRVSRICGISSVIL